MSRDRVVWSRIPREAGTFGFFSMIWETKTDNVEHVVGQVASRPTERVACKGAAMKRPIRSFVLTLTAILLLLGFSPNSLSCGKERWPVKVLTDSDRDKIIQTPQAATVTDLGKSPDPSDQERIANDKTRIQPEE